MAIIKTFNKETGTWEAVTTNNAAGIYASDQTLREERGYNVETILTSLNDDVNTLKRNVTWLAKYGGGGSGSGGGSGTGNEGKILVTDGKSSAYNDDSSRQMTLTDDGLVVKVEHPYKTYLFQITIEYKGNVIKRGLNCKELSITKTELVENGVTESGELVIVAYHQASLTTITWTGKIIVAKVEINGMSSYTVSYDQLETSEIQLSVSLSISGAYFYEVSGSSIITEADENGNMIKKPKAWGPITISSGAQYYAGTQNNISIPYNMLVDENGKNYIMPGNNTLTVKFVQNDNESIYNTYVFNVVLETTDPTFICNLSEDPNNRTIFSLYTANVSVEMPFTIIYAGHGTFVYKVNINGDTTSAWSNNYCSWGKEVGASITIYDATVGDYELELVIKDSSTQTTYSNKYYIKVVKPSSGFLKNTHEDEHLLFNYWGQESNITNSTWIDSTKNKIPMVIHNANPVSQNIKRFYNGRGLRFQNACYATIDISDIKGYFTGSAVAFTLEFTYRADYHPDDDRILFQWADLQGDIVDETNPTQQHPGVPTKGICIKAHELYVLGTKIVTLVDKEIINITITFSSSTTSTNGNILIYIDGVIEATLRDIDIKTIIPDSNEIIIGAGYYANKDYVSNYRDFSDFVLYRLQLYKSCLSPYDIVLNYLNTAAACNLTSSDEPNTSLISEGLTRNFIEVDDSGNIKGSKLYDLTGAGAPEQFDNTAEDLSKHFSVHDFVSEINGQLTINNSVSAFRIPIPIVLINVSSHNSWSWENFLTGTSSSQLPTVTSATISYYDQTYDIGTAVNANFKILNCSIEIQGTSTKGDPIKNLQVTFENNCLFSPRPDWFPEESYTLKADIVDSSHSLNTSIGKFANTELGFDDQLNSFYPYSTTVANKFRDYKNTDMGKMFSDAKIKHGVEGFPVFVIIKFAPDSKNPNGELKSLGIYQFILGRKSPRNLGYEFITSIKDQNGAPVKIDKEKDYPLYIPDVSVTTDDVKGYWVEFGMNQSMDDTIQYASLNSVTDGIKFTGPFWQLSPDYYDTFMEIKYSNLGAEAKDRVMDITPFYEFAKNVQQLPFTFRHQSILGESILNNTYSGDKTVYWDEYAFVKTESPDGTAVGENAGTWEKTDGRCSGAEAGDGLMEIIENLNLSSYAKYFVVMMFFGLVDNFMKNMPIKLYRTDRKDSNDEFIWETPLIGIYDTDTGIGQDNQGGQTITEDLWLLGLGNISNRFSEVPADKATNSTIAGSSNKLWYFDTPASLYSVNNGRIGSWYADAWYDFLDHIIKNHPADGISINSIECLQHIVDVYYNKYFITQTDGCGELLFNLTYISKYLTNYADNLDSGAAFADITKKLHGRRKYQVKSWMSKRVKFLNSMFNALGTTTSKNMAIPINEGQMSMALSDKIQLKTNNNLLVRTVHQGDSRTTSFTYFKKNEVNSVYWGNTNAGTAFADYKLKHSITNPDTIVAFGDLLEHPDHPLYYKGFSSIDTGPFPSLIEYNVSAPEKSAMSLSKLAPFTGSYMSNTFKKPSGDESELRIIDFRNANAGDIGEYTLDISTGFSKLQELRLSNSCINTVKLPNDVSLKNLDVKQSNITSLELNQQNFITEADVSGCAVLNKIDILNCAKIEKLTLNSSNAAIKSVTIANTPCMHTINFNGVPQLQEVNITGCPMLSSITINNCKSLKTVNIELGDKLQTITITSCASASQLNITGDTLNILKTLNIQGSTFTGITYKIDSKTFEGYTDEERILDVSPLTSLTSFNTQNNTAVEYVRFANNVDKPFVLSHTFQGCTKLKRVFGHIQLTSKSFSGTTGIFYGCKYFSIHGIIDTRSSEGLNSTINNVKFNGKSIYNSSYNNDVSGSNIKSCIQPPFYILTTNKSQWANYTRSNLFQSGTDKTNISLSAGESLLDNMFYNTSISTFDVYYMLNIIATYRNNNKYRLYSTFWNDTEDFYPIFDWSINNNPHRWMFAYCTNITKIQHGFKCKNHIYICSHVDDNKPSVFNSLVNCTYMYNVFMNCSHITTRNIFKCSSHISNGYKNSLPLEEIYFLSLNGIVESETGNYVTYANVNSLTGTAYINYLGNCTGMFTVLTKLKTLYSVLSSTLLIDFNTVTIPTNVQSISHSINGSYSKGNIIIPNIFPSGSRITHINNSFNSSNAIPSGEKSVFFIYSGMFNNTLFLQSFGYQYNNDDTINANVNYTQSSASGGGIIKRIVTDAVSQTPVDEFPFDIFDPIKTTIRSLCSFFENCDNSFDEKLKPKLPGDLFTGCSKLRAVPKLFKNVKFTYELTPNSFKDCPKLHNIYQIFYQSPTANERYGITGQIPYKLFYHGGNTKPAVYNGYVFMKFAEYTASVDNIVQLQVPTAGQIPESLPTDIRNNLTIDIVGGNYVYSYNNKTIYRDTAGYMWYDSGMEYDPVKYKNGNKQVEIKNPTDAVNYKLYNTTTNTFIADNDGNIPNIDIDSLSWEYETVNQSIIYAHELFVGNLLIEPYKLEKTNLNTLYTDSNLKNQYFRLPKADGYTHYKAKNAASFTILPADTADYITKYNAYWVYDGNYENSVDYINNTDYRFLDKLNCTPVQGKMFNAVSNGNKNDTVQYICAPDLLRYVSNNISTSIYGLFKNCGLDISNGTLSSGTVGPNENIFTIGLYGRIVPYLFRHLTYVTDLHSMFKNCRKLSSYIVNNTIYQIPYDLFTNMNKVITLYDMFSGLAFYTNTSLNVFSGVSDSGLDIRNIFSHVLWGHNNEQYNISNVFTPYNITYASGAFSATLMNINEAKSGTTYSDSGWVKPLEQTASFANRNINFNQNFNKVINTDTYYLYYGYNHSTVSATEDKISLSDRYNYTPA